MSWRTLRPGVCLLVALAVCPHPAPAEHYAILFAGGVEPDENMSWYYDEVYKDYQLIRNEWQYKPENIWIIFADGMDPGADQYRYVGSNVSSDWSVPDAQGAHVKEANYANLTSVLTMFEDLDEHDLFYWFSSDHGGGEQDDKELNGEEYLCFWGPTGISAPDFGDRCSRVGAMRQAYVIAECYSGGVLRDLNIYDGEQYRFGCASCTHFEKSYSWTESEGLNAGWNYAIEDGLTETHELYETARDDMGSYWDPDFYAWGGEGPWSPVDEQMWMVTHPWKRGADLDLVIARWEGSGVGGHTSEDFHDGENWYRGLQADRTAIIAFDEPGLCRVTQDDEVGFLSIDADGSLTEQAAVLLESGELTVNGAFCLGDKGYGGLGQSGGTLWLPEYAILGAKNYSFGDYRLTDGYISNKTAGVLYDLMIGKKGHGRLMQTGGLVNIYGTVTLGFAEGGWGTYDISGPHEVKLWADHLVVGAAGLGQFHQSGGVCDIDYAVMLGRDAGGDGQYEMTGGLFGAQSLIVGQNGQGRFTQTGGTIIVDNNLDGRDDHCGQQPGGGAA